MPQSHIGIGMPNEIMCKEIQPTQAASTICLFSTLQHPLFRSRVTDSFSVFRIKDSGALLYVVSHEGMRSV